MKKQQLRQILSERDTVEECIKVELENETYIIPKEKKRNFLKFLKKGSK